MDLIHKGKQVVIRGCMFPNKNIGLLHRRILNNIDRFIWIQTVPSFKFEHLSWHSISSYCCTPKQKAPKLFVYIPLYHKFIYYTAAVSHLNSTSVFKLQFRFYFSWDQANLKTFSHHKNEHFEDIFNNKWLKCQ